MYITHVEHGSGYFFFLQAFFDPGGSVCFNLDRLRRSRTDGAQSPRSRYYIASNLHCSATTFVSRQRRGGAVRGGKISPLDSFHTFEHPENNVPNAQLSLLPRELHGVALWATEREPQFSQSEVCGSRTGKPRMRRKKRKKKKSHWGPKRRQERGAETESDPILPGKCDAGHASGRSSETEKLLGWVRFFQRLEMVNEAVRVCLSHTMRPPSIIRERHIAC